ncbi:MAG: branched-chain amino acid ABC transporter permease [Lachnospiraceae bacterium]|nr:branched-chain amino acid ABC transporter permease [Lachnospiraceae bacterium]
MTFVNNNKKWFSGLALAIVLIVVSTFFIKSQFVFNLMALILIWSVNGMGWNVIGGYCGQVSNGHALYYGIGAYTVGILAQKFGFLPWVSIPIGMILSAAIAFIIGKPLLRLQGHVFAISTMALAESVRIIFNNWNWVGGATGVFINNKKAPEWLALQFKDMRNYVYVYLAFAVLVLILIKYLDRSKFFYYLRTIKGNELAAESIGIDAPKYKNRAYMLSAAIVSLGGSMYAQFIRYIDPATLLTLNVSMMIVLVAVMGGIGTVEGPILGAIIMQTISEYSRKYLGTFGGLDLVLYGVLVILIVLFIPGGILSIFKKKKPAEAAADTGERK